MARPPVRVDFIPSSNIPSAVRSDLEQLVVRVNLVLADIYNRMETDVTFEGQTPSTPANFSVEGRVGGFLLRWTPVSSTIADGYIITRAKDQIMRQIDAWYLIPGIEPNSFFSFIGNSAETRYFQIRSKNGKKLSQPSAAVSATSSTTGTPESSPVDPPEWAPVPEGPEGTL